MATERTASGIPFVRTPDSRFESLPGYPFAPKYATNDDGLRMHYVDEGPRDGPVVLVLEGQPSWSYGSRKLVAPLAAGGCRVVVPDHVGMGRSDKVTDEGLHTYEQHVHWLLQFISALGLRDITMVMTDWGGNFGFRLLADRQRLFARVVFANCGVAAVPGVARWILGPPAPLAVDPADRRTCAEMQAGAHKGGALFSLVAPRLPAALRHMLLFKQWASWARTSVGFHPAGVLEAGFLSSAPDHPLSAAELAAFDAPFPTEAHMVAPRTFPSMMHKALQAGWVTDPVAGNAAALERLRAYHRPVLTLCGDKDGARLGSPENQARIVGTIPGARGMAHERFADAHHFILDDHAAEVADRVLKFIGATPRAAGAAVGDDYALPPLPRRARL